MTKPTVDEVMARHARISGDDRKAAEKAIADYLHTEEVHCCHIEDTACACVDALIELDWAPRPKVSRQKLHRQIGGSIGLGEPPALLVGRVIDVLRESGIGVID